MYSNVVNDQPNVSADSVERTIGGYSGLTMLQNNTQQQGTSSQHTNNGDISNGTPCSNTATSNVPQPNTLPQYQQQYQMNGVKNSNYTNSPLQQDSNPYSHVDQIVGDMKHLAVGHNVQHDVNTPTSIANSNQRLNLFNSNNKGAFSTSTPEHSASVSSLTANNQSLTSTNTYPHQQYDHHHHQQQQQLNLSSSSQSIKLNVSPIEKVGLPPPRPYNQTYSNTNIIAPTNYYPNEATNRVITNGDVPQLRANHPQGVSSIPPQVRTIPPNPNVNAVPFISTSTTSNVQVNSSRNTIHGKRYPSNQQKQHSTMQSANNYQQLPSTQYHQQVGPGGGGGAVMTPSTNEQQQQHLVHTQQPLSYQQQSVTASGFDRLWNNTSAESFDLLQTSNILAAHGEAAPRIQLPFAPHSELNCSPDVFRCTLSRIPESAALLHKSRLPLGVLIHPFKDLTQLPVIQCSTIVRCRSCRTYINPFVHFVDNKRWKCNLCYRVNELPEEFQYDPVTKTYGDPSRRPEVRASTIEYIAPAEYMLRPPQPAVYLFLLDISRAAVESGYLHTVCSVLLDELDRLPGDARTQLGFLAFDTTLHFYSLPEGSTTTTTSSTSSNGIPHEMIVWDIDDPFLPSPDNLLVNLQSRKGVIRDLLQQLPTRYGNTNENGSCLGAALQAAHKLMAGTGGRVTVFQATLPTIGPGALTSREDPNERAGSSGATQHLLNPANDFYKRLALECSGQQISVDLFLVNSQYVDVATVSGISKFSGGSVYHFPLYKAAAMGTETMSLQQTQLNRTLRRYITRKIGFEAVMRVRCSRGLSIHAFHGHFFVRSTDLLSLPNVSPDAAFGMQVAIDESLTDAQTVCFQAALLYTSSKAERRIRVHTLCVPVANTLTDILHSADQQAILSLLAKMAVDRSIATSLSDAKDACLNAAVDILSSYKLSQNLSSGGSLMAPNCLRLLPLYIAALLRHPALRVGVTTRLDDRVKAMCDLKSQSVHMIMLSVYPDLYPVHNILEWHQHQQQQQQQQQRNDPPRLQLSARSIDRTGAYLMDCGTYMMLLVCPQVSPHFLHSLPALPQASTPGQHHNQHTPPCIEFAQPEVDDHQNVGVSAFRLFLDRLNEDRPMVAPLLLIREDNVHHRQLFLERLVEDRLDSALSYHEFLQHIRAQVK